MPVWEETRTMPETITDARAALEVMWRDLADASLKKGEEYLLMARTVQHLTDDEVRAELRRKRYIEPVLSHTERMALMMKEG